MLGDQIDEGQFRRGALEWLAREHVGKRFLKSVRVAGLNASEGRFPHRLQSFWKGGESLVLGMGFYHRLFPPILEPSCTIISGLRITSPSGKRSLID
jgi:hypothetical protein